MANSISPIFSQDLYKGLKHDDVKRLQQLLNSDPDTQLAAGGDGSPGNETDYYGPITEKAVQKFQKKYNIVAPGTPKTTGYGRVGAKTRTKLAEVFGEKKTSVIPSKAQQETEGDIMSELKLRKTNPGTSTLTNKIRYDEINYVFGYTDPKQVSLQCTEYVQFRVKQVLDHIIEWKVKSGRHGGRWPGIFEEHGPYKVGDAPKKHSAMCFTTGFRTAAMNNTGHVAFVEEVLPGNKVRISEANWDNKGSYSEREIGEGIWKGQYRCRFVYFS